MGNYSLNVKQRAFMDLLQRRWALWTSAVEFARIGLAYTRVIHELRGKGILIANRIEIQSDGTRQGFYRLGPKPTPRSAEIRARQRPGAKPAEFHSVEAIEIEPRALFDLHRGPD